jgi:cell division inhibitor SepF
MPHLKIAAPILREDDMANPMRKAMVYLGLADEDYDDHVPAAPVAASTKHAAPGMNEILTVNPRQYKDVQAIAEAFREGVPVIMNLSQMPEPDARRLIDFASGLASGLYGKIERVTNKVFLLSPEHVAVSGEAEEPESDVDAGFFGQ